MTNIAFPRMSLSRLILMLTITLPGMITDAQATPSIMAANGAPACSSCHAGGAFSKAEGKAGLAAYLASKTPICKAPQVLKNNICVTPASAPTCTAPQVLQNNVCVTPASTPTCTAPQVLQNNVCVTPASAPTACGKKSYGHHEEDDGGDEDDLDHHDDSGYSGQSEHILPTLSAPDKVSVHAGEPLKLTVTAFDCADRPINIQAIVLPKGAEIINSIDPDLGMPKAVISWTPPANIEGKHKKIVLKAVASDGGNKKTASFPQTVLVEVLPPAQSQPVSTDTLVKSNTVASARFDAKSQKLEVSGQVMWTKNSAKQERQAIIIAETAILSDATTGIQLGSASVDKNGKWQASIATNDASAPCSVDVSFHGKTGVKAVKGVQHCQK